MQHIYYEHFVALEAVRSAHTDTTQPHQFYWRTLFNLVLFHLIYLNIYLLTSGQRRTLSLHFTKASQNDDSIKREGHHYFWFWASGPDAHDAVGHVDCDRSCGLKS